MSALNKQDIADARILLTKDETTLYLTAQTEFKLFGPAGEVTVSPSVAAEWSDFEAGDPEFYNWVHNYECSPYGLKPCDQAFLELKKIKIRERFQKLQKLPSLNLCVIQSNSRLDFVQLGPDVSGDLKVA